MEIDVIKNILTELVLDLSSGQSTRLQVVNQLLSKITPGEIGKLDRNQRDWEFVDSIYFSLYHLVGESGFETPDQEIQYYAECIKGQRIFSNEDLNIYLRSQMK